MSTANRGLTVKLCHLLCEKEIQAGYYGSCTKKYLCEIGIADGQVVALDGSKQATRGIRDGKICPINVVSVRKRWVVFLVGYTRDRFAFGAGNPKVARATVQTERLE